MAPRKGKAKAKSRETEMLTIYADILQETEETDEHEGAILINCGDAKGVWLPISQIQFDGERGDTDVEITLPDWLAEQEGLHDGQGKRAAGEAGDQPAPVSGPEEGELVAAEGDEGQINPAPEQPTTFTFTADVEAVYERKYVLFVTNDQGGTASLEFHKEDVTFAGEEITDLEEGYKGIEFTTSWDLAVEKHLPEFLNVPPVPVVLAADDPDYREVDSAGDSEPQARPCRNFLRKETILAEIKLTEAEKNQCAKRITDALEARAQHKETAASYSAKAKTAEKEAYKAMETFKLGREERRIDCDVIADFNAGQAVWMERDFPYREIQRRPLTEKDRQLTLPIIDDVPFDDVPATPKEEAALADASGSDDGKSCETCKHGHDGEEQICMLDPALPNCEDFSAWEAAEAEESQSDELPRICETCGRYNEDQSAPECDGCYAVDGLPNWLLPPPSPERTCGTCIHIITPHAEDEPDPCSNCGGDNLPNYIPQDQPAEAAGAVQ